MNAYAEEQARKKRWAACEDLPRLARHERINRGAVGVARAHYRSHACHMCGRGYPDTLLNYAAFPCHAVPTQCLDVRSCRRAVRKARGKSPKCR